jgi:hypothetical protein
MLQTNTTPSMTLDTLKKSDLWAKLSKQQRLMLTEFLVAGLIQGNYDIEAAVRAVRVAYPNINVKNLKVWMSRLERNPKIRAVLAYYFGDPQIVVVLKEIQMLIKRTKRKGAPLRILLAPWLKTVAALEAIAAKETVGDVKAEN